MAGTARSDDTTVTLAQMIAGTEPLTQRRAIRLLREAAQALDRFHARYDVHGALCLQAFSPDAQLVLLVVPPDASMLTAAEVVACWSPQRQAGLPPRPSDDLYALGIVAEQVLAAAGTPVRSRPQERTSSGHAEGHADSFRSNVVTVVRALTSWSPAERPASGAEVVRLLDQVVAAAESSLTQVPPSTPGLPQEPPWAAADRVSLARRAHHLAQTTPPRPARSARPPFVRAPLTKGHYPDMPLPLGWVAAIVIVLCSVYLLPLYFMLFPSG